jgi:hypothetical protein
MAGLKTGAITGGNVVRSAFTSKITVVGRLVTPKVVVG